MRGKEVATSPQPSPSQGEGETMPAEMSSKSGPQVDKDLPNAYSQGEGETMPAEMSSKSEASKIRKVNLLPRGEGRVRGVVFARALRQRQTPQEQKVWARLRDRRLNGYKFRRQHPIGPFVADFYCAEARLVVELDGSGHARQSEYDQARTGWLEERGYRVIRFTNTEVDHNLHAVLEKILTTCQVEGIGHNRNG